MCPCEKKSFPSIQVLWQKFSDVTISWVHWYLAKREEKKQKIIATQERYLKLFGKLGAKIADWVVAFVWAAVWVFFINQYFVQAYMIPSESMVPTLRVADRVFVNKLFAGPEVLPGFQKLPAIAKPERGDIIIFSNPELGAGHPVFQVIHRLIYMISLSTIDIGGRENMAQLLVKRAVGANGDHIIFRDGNLYVKPEGSPTFFSEEEFQKISNIHYPVRRIVPIENIDLNRKKATYRAYQLAMTTSHYDEGDKTQLPMEYVSLEESLKGLASADFYDAGEVAAHFSHIQTLYKLMPYDSNVRHQFLSEELGFYIPKNSFLPLGDNRDNSRDGRYFGVISKNDVLGYWLWRFFPFSRLGSVK